MLLAEIGAEPPVGYSSDDAVERFHAAVQAELDDAAAAPELWDARITLTEKDESSYCLMMEAVADRFKDIVPPCHVWGFGSQLWDKSRRVHGSRPLNMMVLGPAAAGKTTIAIELAARFGMRHINAGAHLASAQTEARVSELTRTERLAGDLLYEEVRLRTKLGLRAKRYLDSSRLVPDEILNVMVHERLTQADVADVGFLLDGYPHTRAQVDFLNASGIFPDKVRGRAAGTGCCAGL